MVRTAILGAFETTSAVSLSTACLVASPMIVCLEVAGAKVHIAVAALLQPCPPPPSSEARGARRGARALGHAENFAGIHIDNARRDADACLRVRMAHAAQPEPPQEPPPPPMPTFLVSLPNCETLPTMMASTLSSLPSRRGAGRVGALASWKVLLGHDLLQRRRSIMDKAPSLTSPGMSRPVMPSPTSTSLPNMPVRIALTVP